MFVEKLVSRKTRKIIAWIIGAWLILGTLFFVAIPGWKAKREFFELSYSARVDSLNFQPGHRGHPYVLTNHEWRLLTIDEMKVVPFLKAGDSLVKVKRSIVLHVYRRNGEGYQLIKSFN